MINGKKGQLETFIQNISQKHKKDISIYDRSFLLNLAEKRQENLGLPELSDYLDYLFEDQEEADQYFRLIGNTYSCFFRDSLVCAYLKELVIPDVLRNKRAGGEIRVWSAGCAAVGRKYTRLRYIWMKR